MKALAQVSVFSHVKTEKAQLYFNGAELQQTTKVSLAQGTSEIVLLNVANTLDINTIQIKSLPSVTVLSVQFSNDPITGIENHYVSEGHKSVYDAISRIESQINENQLQKNATVKSLELLDKNQTLSGQNMNTAELSKLLEFYKTKRFELERQIGLLTQKADELQKELNILKFQLGNSQEQSKNNNGKLILQVMNEKSGDIPFEINYITYQARWTPFYEIRINKTNAPITLNYKANITQSCGTDWKNIKLGLSSGYINNQHQSPTLSPWFISYKPSKRERLRELRAESTMKVKAAYTKNMESGELTPNVPPTYLQNTNLGDLIVINENHLNISFDIEIPYTILSNGKNHGVSLKKLEIPANFTHYSVPKLDHNVYLLAKIENYGKYNLLAGQANVIFENNYVGKTYINPQETEQQLLLSLGKDKKIVAERKLIAEKSENKVLSSKKLQSFTYEITLRNNKNESVTVDVEDQYPINSDKTIKVSLGATDGASNDTEKGILKWKIQLQPNQTQKIRFSYQVESEKERNIFGL
ncbi:membrane protein [Capnocytophaga canimorsus]|nr:membrane protein [Capnocytophaga canimorsus]